jgi:signal transduction histidine kinase
MTRRAVIEDAYGHFRKGGLAAVRLDAVDGAAAHFEDDAALRRALVVDNYERSAAAVEQGLANVTNGEAALDAFVRSYAQPWHDHPSHVMLHLAGAQPGDAELLQPNDEFRRAGLATAHRAFGGVERKLLDDWGDELPHGIHPRRLVFVAYNALVGMAAIRVVVNDTGETLRHSADELADELRRALISPTAAMRQLGALNDVASKMAGMRDEATLVASAPALLCSSLDFAAASFLIPDESGELQPHAEVGGDQEADADAPPEYRRAVDERSTIVATGSGRDFIVAPVLCQGEIYGALAGHLDEGSRTLDRRDVSRFETFATMVGLALDNARWVSLIQAEKMASLSKLVAGMAHEFNTPLGALIASADVSERALGKLSDAIENGDTNKITRALTVLRRSQVTTKEAGARIDERVAALRNFARLDESERKRANLHEGIDSALMLLGRQLEGAKILRHYGELPAIVCFPNELNQVFLNLLTNAAMAIGERGEIRISTSFADGEVALAFADDGSGIALEHILHIFEPGFTRWGVNVGSGLGLSTCQQIVVRHDGRIDVHSEFGTGSRFTVRIPLR